MDELAERFLEEEARVKVKGLDPMDRARFHRAVRQCASNWKLSSQATVRMTKSKNGMALHFEGPLNGKVISLFSLRANHKNGEFRFIGPNPDRKRLGLSEDRLEALERMRDLYEALLSGAEGAGESVSALLNGKRTPDLVPLVEETRRALDGSHESPPPPRIQMAPSGAGADAPKASPRQRAAAASRRSPGVRSETAADSDAPRARATLQTLRLACPDPKEVAAFYARVLKTRPDEVQGDESLFRLGGFTLVVAPDLDRGERQLYQYGSTTKNRGWGFLPTVTVPDFDLCLRRARRMETAVIHENLARRTFTVKDPAGYVLAITEA